MLLDDNITWEVGMYLCGHKSDVFTFLNHKIEKHDKIADFLRMFTEYEKVVLRKLHHERKISITQKSIPRLCRFRELSGSNINNFKIDKN